MADFNKYLEEIKKKGLYRTMRSVEDKADSLVKVKDKKLINLSSNDYLGIAVRTGLQDEFYSGMSDLNHYKYSLGSASSRLITGNSIIYDEFEISLSDKIGKEASVIFNSGYHANIGILPAITSKRDLILSDKLNHASIIDGIKLSDSDHKRYKHLDYSHLKQILTNYRTKYENVIIVSESLFSMDGDIADIKELVDIKNEFDCMLYIDEAHSFGCYGDTGMGICHETGLVNDVDIIVGTFGKAIASQGAFAALSSDLKEVLVNKMRSLIFTTALPPVSVAWSLFIINRLHEFENERKNLHYISGKLRESFKELGIETRGESFIVPAMTYDNDKTLKLSELLQHEGFLISAIRPPTVPPNTSRLRLSLTANLKWEDIEGVSIRVIEFLT